MKTMSSILALDYRLKNMLLKVFQTPTTRRTRASTPWTRQTPTFAGSGWTLWTPALPRPPLPGPAPLTTSPAPRSQWWSMMMCVDMMMWSGDGWRYSPNLRLQRWSAYLPWRRGRQVRHRNILLAKCKNAFISVPLPPPSQPWPQAPAMTGKACLCRHKAPINSVISCRKWRILVTQIRCDSLVVPPQGCLQYHWGETGEIMRRMSHVTMFRMVWQH